MLVERGEHIQPCRVETEQEHPQHPRKEHQDETPDDAGRGEERIAANDVEIVAAREPVDRLHQDRRERVVGARRGRCRQPREAEQDEIQRDRRGQPDERPPPHRSIVAADERDQGEPEHGIREQDVPHPDQQRMRQGDEREADEPSLEEPHGVGAARGRALHEHEEADPKQE